MKKKVLVFFPHNPCPPKTGAHRRCLEVMSGLRALGCHVTLASSTLSSETRWDANSIRALEAGLVDNIRVYENTPFDLWFYKFAKNFYQGLNKEPPINSIMHTSPRMRRWFSRVFREISPDIVLMNYAFWDGLLNNKHRKAAVCVIDSIDLVSLNARMRAAIEGHLPTKPINLEQIGHSIIEEDYYKKLALAVSENEYGVYDKYDLTIAITSWEAELIRSNTINTQVLHIPVTCEVKYLQNTYSGCAVFPVGANPFNIQGYLYFIKRILPIVRQTIPTFLLEVPGTISSELPAVENVKLCPFTSELEALYQPAKFLICPILGKTGQQIKIVEAMAHGVPVIAMRSAAEGSPLVQGENGFIADSAKEFAAYVMRLWNDTELCRNLGGAAREAIAQEYSTARLLEDLSALSYSIAQ